MHLILGGRNKGGDPAELLEVAERRARRVYLVGEAAREIDAVLRSRVETVQAGTLDTAVEEARAAARPGEVVLLSPACASFDQYADFAARGDHFQRLVRSLDG